MKSVTTSDRWLKSYGDNNGDYEFDGQSAIASDPYDTIYVAETRRNKIVKLYIPRFSFVREGKIFLNDCRVIFQRQGLAS